MRWDTEIRFKLNELWVHTLQGFIVFAPCSLLGVYIFGTLGIFLGTCGVALWYWSRERFKYEDSHNNSPWYFGWTPFEWPMWDQLDFYVPVMTSVVFVVIVYAVLLR